MATTNNKQSSATKEPPTRGKLAASRIKHIGKATTSAAKHPNRTLKKEINGFRDFLGEASVVGIAIGLVLGTQVKTLVDQVMTSFINPLIGIILPGTGGLAGKSFVIHARGKLEVFAWGAFVSALLSFIVLALLVYYTYKALRLDKLKKT